MNKWRMAIALATLVSTLFVAAGESAGSADSPDAVFSQAWIAYQNGRFDEAESLTTGTLNTGNLTNYHSANFHYLLGFLEARKEDGGDRAIEHFTESRDLYHGINKSLGEYNANQGMIKVLIDMRRLGEAETALQENLGIAEEEGYATGFVHYLFSQVAFERDDYAAGLRHSQNSLASYRAAGSKSGEANALAEVGFFMMVTGNLEEGYDYALHAEAKVVESGDQNKLDYNRINTILYQRCTQGFASPRQVSWVRQRAESDRELQKMLDFVLNYSCGSQLQASSQ